MEELLQYSSAGAGTNFWAGEPVGSSPGERKGSVLLVSSPGMESLESVYAMVDSQGQLGRMALGCLSPLIP